MQRRLNSLPPLNSLSTNSVDDGFNESLLAKEEGGEAENDEPKLSSPNSSADAQVSSESTPNIFKQSVEGFPNTILGSPISSADSNNNNNTAVNKTRRTLWPIVVTLTPANVPASSIGSSVDDQTAPTLSLSQDLSYGEFFSLETLGHGSSAQVVKKVLHRPSRKIMACKSIQLFPNPSNIGREIDIHSKCNGSPDIVHFYGSFVHNGLVHLCTEFMDGGSFDDIYRRHGRVPEDILAQVAFAVVKGLYYLKTECHVIHRDIKPSNILANTRGDIKLCDFSVSGVLVNSLAKSFVGCRPYMSPELLGGSSDGYTIRSDIWSLGISLIELAYAQCPIPPLNAEQMHNLMTTTKIKSKPSPSTDEDDSLLHSPVALLQYYRDHPSPTVLTDYFSIDFKYFVDQCLRKDPLERPLLTALLEHDFILLHKNCTQQNVANWVQSTLSPKVSVVRNATRTSSERFDGDDDEVDVGSASSRRRWRRWMCNFQRCKSWKN